MCCHISPYLPSAVAHLPPPKSLYPRLSRIFRISRHLILTSDITRLPFAKQTFQPTLPTPMPSPSPSPKPLKQNHLTSPHASSRFPKQHSVTPVASAQDCCKHTHKHAKVGTTICPLQCLCFFRVAQQYHRPPTYSTCATPPIPSLILSRKYRNHAIR